MKNSSPGKRLRRLIKKKTLLIPGAHNALSALQIEQAGFDAVYISGAGMANGVAGLPDVGLLTLTEVITQVRYITKAVNVPAIADADTGFGDGIHLRRAIEAFESAGVAAIQIEDQVFPKRCGHLSGKEVIPALEMAQKIKTAVAARKDPDLLIIARTDARGVTNFQDAVDRAKRYLDAGADIIFPEALKSADEFFRFADALPALLMANMTEFGKSPPLGLEALAEMGYRLVLFPMTLLRIASKEIEEALEQLKKAGTSSGMLGKMQPRQDLYQLIGYDEINQLDLGKASPPKEKKREQ
ncbi:MAG: methylisocitrate lyase [Nitrospira sp.]|nr:methylisocitrate lyase [Candidatus Manganitrophaceae bacterium]HIL34343.1 methylisocitrate lyase [Candidatus Manganitrophaceae bacterium]